MTYILLQGPERETELLADLARTLEGGIECASVRTLPSLFSAFAQRSADIVVLAALTDDAALAQTLARIRAFRGGAEALVAFVAPASAKAQRLAAVEAGVDDLLTAPIEPIEFVTRMHRLLETRRMRRELSAARSETSDLRRGFVHLPGFAILLNGERRIVAISAQSARLFGRSADDMIGEMPETFMHPEDGATRQVFEQEILATGVAMPVRDEELIDARGNPHPCWIARGAVRDERGGIVGVVACALPRLAPSAQEGRDIDPMTQLPNRNGLGRWLDVALAGAGGTKTEAAAVLFGIANLAEIAAASGLVMADRARVGFARRLQAMRRGAPEDRAFVGLLGNDVFIDIRLDAGPKWASGYGATLREKLVEPYRIGGEIVTLDVWAAPMTAADLDDLDASAEREIAVQRSAHHDRARAALAVCEALPNSPASSAGGATLRGAMERRELGLHYQAQIDLSAGQISGLEALLRWRRPGSGWVPAHDLLEGPIAEQDAVAFSDWIIREVAEQTRDMFAHLPPLTRLSVVVTHIQSESEAARSAIASSLRTMGPLVSRLDIRAKAEDAARLGEHLHAHYAAGGALTLDIGTEDPQKAFVFGLEGLKRAKISLRSPFATESLLAALVHKTRVRGIDLIGADVESADDLALLRQVGAAQGQGYLLHMPCAAEELVAQARSGQL